MEAGKDVGQRADGFLDLPFYQFDRASIETGAGQLGEIAVVAGLAALIFHAREVNQGFASLLDGFPGCVEAWGNADFARENIDGAQGQYCQTTSLEAAGDVADPVEDFVESAVASGGDDGVVTFLDGCGAQLSGLAC